MPLYMGYPGQFANSPPAGAAEPPQQQPLSSPDLVSQFFERLMNSLNEDEPSAEEMVPQAQTPMQGFRMDLQNRYAWQPEEQRLQRGNLIYGQQMQAMNERRQRPAKVAQAQGVQRDRNVNRALQGVNAAGLLEQRQATEAWRQAQIAKLQQDPTIVTPGMRPGTEGTVQVQGPDGEPILMLKSEALARLRAGENLNVPYRMQARAGIGPEGAMFGNYDPFSGQGLGGMSPVPNEGTMRENRTTISLLNQTTQAMEQLDQAVKTMGKGTRAFVDIARQIPGGSLAMSYFSPQGEITASALDNVGDILLRLRSGAQISEPEYQRLRALLPRLGENFVTAQAKFKRFYSEMAVVMENNQRLYGPGLVPQELIDAARKGARGAEQSAAPQRRKTLSSGKVAVEVAPGQWEVED